MGLGRHDRQVHSYVRAALLTAALALSTSTGWSQSPAYTLRARSVPAPRAFTGPAPLRLDLVLERQSVGTTETLQVTAFLRDSTGNLEDRSKVSVQPIARSQTVSLRLMPRKVGFHAVEAVVTNQQGTQVARYETGYAVLRPLPTPKKPVSAEQVPFGVCLHFDHGQGDLTVTPTMLRLAGIRWVRDTMYWNKVEKQAGVYAIPEYNLSALRAIRKQGIEPLIVLGFGNPIYQHATQEEATAFGRYAELVARELRGVTSHFEIWNEPQSFGGFTPAQYVPIMRAGAEGVRRGNPQAFVVGIGGAAPGGWSGHFIPDICKAGAAAVIDTFSIHPYTSPLTCDVGYSTEGAAAPLANLDLGAAHTASFAEDIREARHLPKAPGIWITEMGWPSNAVGFDGQAQQAARAYLMTAALPQLYSRIFLYDFICDGPSTTENEHNFGLLSMDGSVRPAYVAAATAARSVANRPFLRRVTCPNDSVRLYLFGPESDPLLVAWVTEVSPAEMIAGKRQSGVTSNTFGHAGSDSSRRAAVAIRCAGKRPSVREWQDQDVHANLDHGVLRLTLSPWPLYIRGLGAASAVSVEP